MIGCLIALVGPARQMISREVDRARGSPIANALIGRAQVSERKLLALRLTLSLVTALIWPLALYSLPQEKATRHKTHRESVIVVGDDARGDACSQGTPAYLSDLFAPKESEDRELRDEGKTGQR